MDNQVIGIIDFGSQTTELIARRVRQLHFKSIVFPENVTKETIDDAQVTALILSGGPRTITAINEDLFDRTILSKNLPTLGICYGMQLLVKHFGGEVYQADHKEFGIKSIGIDACHPLFKDLPSSINVWMSHHDQVRIEQDGFLVIAKSDSCPIVAVADDRRKIFGVQFHPEVTHTKDGQKIIENFLKNVACLTPDYFLDDALKEAIDRIKQEVGQDQVLMALSGGVDSSVAATLIHKAIKDQLHCVFVDHGLHREGEVAEVRRLFKETMDMNLTCVDARELFFTALKDISDPEEKRKIIGRVFIEVFEQEAKRFHKVAYLGQGTIYSDVIESKTTSFHQAIKSHHNVGGLPPHLKFKLLEPLRELFKDEVRELGLKLGLPKALINRQPMPGPGLAIRLPGEVTPKKVDILCKADAIVVEEIEKAQSLLTIPPLWQWFAVLLPVKSVGVMGDARCYGYAVAVRCVMSIDAMTADWAPLPHELLQRISTRITNEVQGVTRVLYDITQKPPGTIEWE